MEPITTGAAAVAIIAIKAWCAAHYISVGLPVIMAIAQAFLTGGRAGAIDAAYDNNAPSELINALKDIFS